MTSRPIQDRGAASARNRLLEAAQHGDLDALEQLARLYEPLVQRVVWKLKLPLGCEREDLAQEARVGLLAAIRAWRPERGPFPAFADRCVSNQALLALEAATAQKHQVLSRAIPLDAPQYWRASPAHDSPSPALIETLTARRDTATDPELRLLVREQLTSVRRALPSLTASERAGLAMAVNGQSPTRLASTLPGSPHAASQAAHRARRKLAAALASLTITRLHTAARSQTGWMSFDEAGRPGPDGAPPRSRRRRVRRVAEAGCGVEVDARDLDVRVPRGRVDRHPFPWPRVSRRSRGRPTPGRHRRAGSARSPPPHSTYDVADEQS